MIKKILVPLILLLTGAGIFFVTKPDRPGLRPNIVLIVVDALRSDHLGIYGNQDHLSPELDQLAAAGIIFENVFAQSSWTRPSLGSLITSHYPRSIGIYREKFDTLDQRHETLAEVLKKNGYATWGVTANPNLNKYFNFHQGFDDYRESSLVWKWMETGGQERKKSTGVSLPKSADIFGELLTRMKRLKSPPAYIQLLLMEVHSPHLIRPEFQGRPVITTLDRKNQFYSEEKVLNLINGTRNAVRQISHDIASFIREVESLARWRDTLFIITSDHGQGLNDHPDVDKSLAHGYLLYQSHLKVPLIFYHSGRKLPAEWRRKIRTPVRLLDLMPTLLEYVGIPEPGNLQGKSLLRLITAGDKSFLPEFFVAETRWRDVNKIALLTKGWIYIENADQLEGVNSLEMQPLGKENGFLTDRIGREPYLAGVFRKKLEKWKKKHLQVKSTQPGMKAGRKETDQLKSLGYLQ